MTPQPDPYRLTEVAPAAGHIASLDGLRAISIALVMLQHFTEGLPGMPPAPGLFGVEIFFAISGFLIARILLAEINATGGLSLANFYFRRALRLTPPLAALVLCVSLFMMASGERDLRASACALSYVTNYCVTEVGVMYSGQGVNLEGMWSLAVEEHFYLMFPLLLLALFRRDIRALYVAVAAICVGALAFRVGYALAGRPDNFLVWRSESAFDLLMGGCALSIMSAHEAGRAALRRVAGTGFLAAATAVFLAAEILSTRGKLGMAITQSAVAFWIAVLLANVLFNPDFASVRSVLNRPALSWLGRVSYSLYLWHVFVALVGNHFQLIQGYAEAIAAILASLALAAASYYLLELPILARRGPWARRLGLGATSPAAHSAPQG